MLVKVNDMGNLHEVNLLEVTAENYICPKGEEHLYHCRIEQKSFNPNTGERTSVPRLQMFDKKQFENGLLHNLRRIGYTVDVLHNPTEWLAKQEAQKKEDAEAAEKARKEAEEAKIQERIKMEVDKALKEAGVTKKGGRK